MESILQDLSFLKIVKWGCAVAMIFGGMVPYIPQYREIKRTENADGFSLFVCLALLIANTLRILFCVIHFDKHYFWAWTDFMSYIDFMLLFTIGCSLLMYLFIEHHIFVQTMVVMWMMGDTFKTAYFIFNNLPLQFWLCGCLQVFIDIFILFQVYLYRQNIGVRSCNGVGLKSILENLNLQPTKGLVAEL
uniref:PQ-loop repeat-containing protein 1 n=1 Tax=Timema genevievae TaxID=629358 RepID=A0A7R9JN13_TIMGE|nr:unnamed protein product [Timema genevievae]